MALNEHYFSIFLLKIVTFIKKRLEKTGVCMLQRHDLHGVDRIKYIVRFDTMLFSQAIG